MDQFSCLSAVLLGSFGLVVAWGLFEGGQCLRRWIRQVLARQQNSRLSLPELRERWLQARALRRRRIGLP